MKSSQTILVGHPSPLHNTPLDTFILPYFICFFTLPYHVLTVQLQCLIVSSALSVTCTSRSPLTCQFVGGRDCVCLDRGCVPSTGGRDGHSVGALQIFVEQMYGVLEFGVPSTHHVISSSHLIL